MYLGGVNRGDRLTQQYYYIWGGVTPPQRQGIQEYVLRGVNRGTAVLPQSKVQSPSIGHGRWEIQSTWLSADSQYCYGGLTGGYGSTLGGGNPPPQYVLRGVNGGQGKSDHYYYYYCAGG